MYIVHVTCTRTHTAYVSHTDCMVNLVISDPSVETMGGDRQHYGIELLIFSPEVDKLPAVKTQPGDVIRLHRVSAQFYAGRPQLVGRCARNRPFAFLLFAAAYGPAAEQPYQSSHGEYG